jgi:pantoate--beta-alanine ligase
MHVISDTQEFREHVDASRREQPRIAFVPTMGNLHEGHLALIRRGLELASIVVASIFVNPLQFGENEDLDAYPRTLEADLHQLASLGVDCVFTPSVHQLYPDGLETHTQVRVPGLTDILCGRSRPGHFDGVTTVVCKLLNIVRPDVAVFGNKDLQQQLVVSKMVRDLALPVIIEGVPTARATDGLALSSRNGYLSPAARQLAPQLYACLSEVVQAVLAGHRDYSALCDEATERLDSAGFHCEYFEARRCSDLKPADSSDPDIAIFAAAQLEGTRLIDNLKVALN